MQCVLLLAAAEKISRAENGVDQSWDVPFVSVVVFSYVVVIFVYHNFVDLFSLLLWLLFGIPTTIVCFRDFDIFILSFFLFLMRQTYFYPFDLASYFICLSIFSSRHATNNSFVSNTPLIG